MTPLLHSKQVEARLGLAPGTLAVQRCRRTGAGRIPFVRVGRAVRYREEDVEQWLIANQVVQH